MGRAGDSLQCYIFHLPPPNQPKKIGKIEIDLFLLLIYHLYFLLAYHPPPHLSSSSKKLKVENRNSEDFSPTSGSFHGLIRCLRAYILFTSVMGLYDTCYEILKIQRFRRMISYAGFYCFSAVVTYAYTNNTTRAGFSRGDQFYASYPAGTEMLTDTAKLYKAALGNCFEVEDWGPIEFCVLAKHFERQGKSPYAYHAQYMAHLLSQGQLDGSG